MSGTAGTVTIASDGPRRFEAYLAQPAPSPEAETHPAILVLSDMFGLNEPIRAVADYYASRGHAALVPNLFWRSDIPGAISYDDPQHAKAWARLKALDLDVVSDDMRAATGWLRAQPFGNGKVAAIGFCGGGRFAFLAAVRCGVDAAASLYGLGISQHVGEIANARARCKHYGLQDQHIRARRSTRSRPACAGGRMSKCCSTPTPVTRSPIRCGRPTIRRGQARRRTDRGDAESYLKPLRNDRYERSRFRPPSHRPARMSG